MTAKRLATLFTAVFLLTNCCRVKPVDSASGDGTGEGGIPVAEASGPLADVNFDFDSSALSPAAREVLEKNYSWLNANPSSTVVIEGHCDERGTQEYNLALGERRAKAVEHFYKNLGVGAKRLNTVSYGEELPLDPAHNEAAWAKNRRAHHKVSQ